MVVLRDGYLRTDVQGWQSFGMACINPDGTLSLVARGLLELLAAPHSAERAAIELELPLFRIRATVRELSRAGLIEHTAAGLTRTALGDEALVLDTESDR